MFKNKITFSQALGVVLTIASLVIFYRNLSFPTPDKLIIFLTFVFMIFGQAKLMLRRLLPFAVLLLAYESFRGIADSLNTHVNYTLAPQVDRFIFGKLPTDYLQGWLWTGDAKWYDIVLYIPYLLFFVLPIGLAILVWKTKDQYYWKVVTTYLTVFFGGFITFLIFPAAPPWLASQNHYIEPITRISSQVWEELGIHNFPSIYNKISPNPVAAIPSLHSACATLFAIFIFKIYGKKWGLLSLIYPAMIYFGVIYEGEHYFFDVFVGICYGVVGYLVINRYFDHIDKFVRTIVSKITEVVPEALKN